MSPRCAKKIQCVGISKGLSPKIALNIQSFESGNLKSVLLPMYISNIKLIDSKAFDTEILSCYSWYKEALQVKAE